MNNISKTIELPKNAIQEKEGIVILPLKKWEKIKRSLEDLEMYSCSSFVKEIEKRRKEKKTIPLEKILKKYNI